MTGELLTYSGAAHRTGLSVRTLERAVARGELEAVRLGRSVRIDPSSLDAWARPTATREGLTT
ncbi:helix-turn-helix domain-containing protein [Microbacterium capsulatum]|uniref:Helix-turn-helix domain-containing protein n=1 Tax=Microbacterium capsulatum TaxID=3041921 RepID=A0ABU0XBI3_9MICO|nr:helix-turn-helix domain-containing protein [Microbacterium sp. ASV81]MDQ4212468.1 helix-turn-helix domain-containing protein [Microbacterium sp. ASV81]